MLREKAKDGIRQPFDNIEIIRCATQGSPQPSQQELGLERECPEKRLARPFGLVE